MFIYVYAFCQEKHEKTENKLLFHNFFPECKSQNDTVLFFQPLFS